MNCPDCLERLQQQLDGVALPDRTLLDAHLTDCPECRAWFTAGRRLAEGLRTLSPVPAPANLTDRIVTGVLAQRRARLRMRRWLVAGAGVAAALLVATLAGTRLFPVPAPAPSPPPAPMVQHDPEPPAGPSLRDSVEEARSAVAALTHDLATKTRAQVGVLLPPLPDMADLEQPLEPAAQSLRDSGRGVSVSLQTVAGSARRAFSFFLRELPLEPERKAGL